MNNIFDSKNISIDKIIEPDWDIRKDTKDDDSDLYGLIQSIKKDGVIQPIIYGIYCYCC
jgi:ParB-like chromosome segregation protein Spo0J